MTISDCAGRRIAAQSARWREGRMRFHHVAAWRCPILVLTLLCALGSTVAAQWLSLPLPGTPRSADGKPNLNAPTPRAADGKPDLSGIWKADNPRYNENLLPPGQEAPMLPAAAELYKHRVATMGYDRPMTRCLPHGVPDAMTVPGLPFKILQVPGVTLVLFEEFHVYRQLFTDGRKLPEDPDPAWYGYSVARWEGDTFVVDTAGFKEGSWLDNSGHPHSEALKLTERFRRVNFGKMELVVNVNDPKVYSRPWTSDTLRFNLQPDTELLEHLCENNRDLEHLQEIWQGKDAKTP
jgi:hypothetical protein